MDRSGLSALFKEEITKQQQSQIFHLISIDIDSDGANVLGVQRLVDANHDVMFDGDNYYSFPCRISGNSVTTTGEVSTTTLTIANPERIFQSLLATHNGLRRRLVTVLTVYAKFVDKIYSISSDGVVTEADNPDKDTTAFIENTYYIEGFSSTAESIVFTLGATADLTIKLPRGRFNPRSCRFDYKDPETCGYAGTLPTCKKDIADCKLHSENGIVQDVFFGGFPGVPTGIRRLRF